MYKIDSPVYINTQFNYFCDSCEKAELELETNELCANGEAYTKSYNLTCKNYAQCKMLMHNLQYKQTWRVRKNEGTTEKP